MENGAVAHVLHREKSRKVLNLVYRCTYRYKGNVFAGTPVFFCMYRSVPQ